MNLFQHRRYAPLALALAGLAMSPVHAQTVFTPITLPGPPTPLVPSIGLPAGDYQGYINNNTHMSFQWTHGGLVLNPPAPTNFFIVCLYPASSTTGCGATGIGSGIPTSFPRTQVVNPLTGPVPGKYNYTFTPSFIADSLLDVPLLWTVRACDRTVMPYNCSTGTPRALYFSTKNIAGTDIHVEKQSSATGGDVFASFTAQNSGATASGAFTATVQILETLDNGGSCERRPAMANASFPSVVLTDGRRVLPSAIPAGATVKAILRQSGDASPLFTYSVPSVNPGDSTTVSGPSASMPTAWMHHLTWRAGEFWRSYVAVGMSDTAGAVRETSETDNGWAECETVFHP